VLRVATWRTGKNIRITGTQEIRLYAYRRGLQGWKESLSKKAWTNNTTLGFFFQLKMKAGHPGA
jgi:hypothetical protein